MRSAALGGDGREAWGPRPDQNVGPSGPGAEQEPVGDVGQLGEGNLEGKAGRIRTSLRALPDLAAVVWRVGEVAGRSVWQHGAGARREECLFAVRGRKGSRQPVGILGAGWIPEMVLGNGKGFG